MLSAFVQIHYENISQDSAKDGENDIQLTSLSFKAVNSQLAHSSLIKNPFLGRKWLVLTYFANCFLLFCINLSKQNRLNGRFLVYTAGCRETT